MPKLIKVENSDQHMFYCPGCKHHHVYDSTKWKFNGDFDKPTFSPSLLNRSSFGPQHELRVCHLFLTDGKLQFCSDCTHELAGKTVELPEIDLGDE